jgi:hypothetical protein
MVTCRECKRLQEEYNEANTIFLAIASEQFHAVDSAARSEANERYRKAGKLRKAARQAIKAHKETH